MASVNALARELVFKIVYYGPPLGGKTTNLRTLYKGYPPEIRGELVVVPAPRAAMEPALSKPKILLVDDDPTSRLTLQTVLEAGGYHVDAAATAACLIDTSPITPALGFSRLRGYEKRIGAALTLNRFSMNLDISYECPLAQSIIPILEAMATLMLGVSSPPSVCLYARTTIDLTPGRIFFRIG